MVHPLAADQRGKIPIRLLCWMRADLSEQKCDCNSKDAVRRTISGLAKSLFWHAALSGGRPSDTEGAKGAKVGHLAQGEAFTTSLKLGGELQGSSAFLK